jgi:hypothetical protein
MLNCKLGELPIKYLGIQMIVKWAWVPWLKCMRKYQKKNPHGRGNICPQGAG